MPEIVEVKKYTDFINKWCKGTKLTAIQVVGGRYKKYGLDGLTQIKKKLPIKILGAESKGKFIYVKLDQNINICFTLGLTGGFIFYPNTKKKYLFPDVQDYTDNTKDWYQTSIKHINVSFTVAGGNLHFHDKLSYGTVSILTDEELNKKLKKIGPEVTAIDYNTFIKIIKGQKGEYIGNAIVNQKIMSGVGNYLRADSLWLTSLNPFRKVKNVTDKELALLHKNILILIWNDYNINYAKKVGLINSKTILPQKYGRTFLIYQQEKDIYGNKIVKEDLYKKGQVKRSIFWVPSIQK